MGGSRHQGEVPSVVCREPLVDQVDVEAAGRLRPRLLRHNASRAKAGFRCLVVDWRREAKRGVRRGQISAANERSDSVEGRCGHLNGGKGGDRKGRAGPYPGNPCSEGHKVPNFAHSSLDSHKVYERPSPVRRTSDRPRTWTRTATSEQDDEKYGFMWRGARSAAHQHQNNVVVGRRTDGHVAAAGSVDPCINYPSHVREGSLRLFEFL